jgi:hypothetical protein
MRLLDECDVAVLETFDEPQLPERTITVEQLLLHAGRERDELLPRARLRQCGMAHVIRDVETVVVDPDRPPLVVGNAHQAAAEPAGSGSRATARGRTSWMRK